MRETDSRYVYEDQRRIERRGPPWDRVGFAMRALRILRPAGLTIAVREGRWDLRVERGRAWGEPEGAQWAVVSIPPDATREHIALALAELAGVHDDPYVMHLLLASPDPQ